MPSTAKHTKRATPDLLAAKEMLAQRLLARTAQTGVMSRFARAVMAAAHPEAAAVPTEVLPIAVHGVGIGRKVTHGRLTDEMCVRLYVCVKLPAAAIRAADRLPPSVDGIPTDVVESPPPVLMQALPNRSRHRPLVAGTSIGNHAIGAGTLGYFCRSVRPGDDPGLIYLLSNNHVLAGNDTLPPGTVVLQPGRLDTLPPYETVAHLARAVPIARGAAGGNLVDAAIALVVGGMELRPTILGVGRPRGLADVGEGDRVCKSGRTTGVTHGRIDDESVDALVGLDPDDPRAVARFRNQMRILRVTAPKGQHDDGDSEFARAGDSGSLVVTAESSPETAGLFFAGATGYGLANPIAAVLQALQIEVL